MACSLSAVALRLLNCLLLLVGLALCATPFVRFASLCGVAASQLETVDGFWVLFALGLGVVVFAVLGCCAASGKAKYKVPYILLLLVLLGGAGTAYFWQNAQGAVEGKLSDLAGATLQKAFDDFGTLYQAGQCHLDQGPGKSPHCATCEALESVMDKCITPSPLSPQGIFVGKCVAKFVVTSECNVGCVTEFCICEATGVFAVESMTHYIQIGLMCLGAVFLAMLVLVLCVKQERDLDELRGRLVVQQQAGPLPY